MGQINGVQATIRMDDMIAASNINRLRGTISTMGR